MMSLIASTSSSDASCASRGRQSQSRFGVRLGIPAGLRIAVAVAALPAVLLGQGQPSTAQKAAIFYGSVLIDQTNQPIADAEIVLTPTIGAHSNAAGGFQISGIAPGSYRVVVRKVGYKPLMTTLTLAAGDSIGADITLMPAVAVLDSIAVTGRQGASPIVLGKMAGYQSRRLQGLGRAVDSATLQKESYRRLGDVVQAHLPVHVLEVGGSDYVASPRGMVASLDRSGQPAGDESDQRRGAKAACYVQVFVDGVRVYNPVKDAPLFDVNSISPTEIQAVEFFAGPSETPPEYGGTGASCGTLLIWTK